MNKTRFTLYACIDRLNQNYLYIDGTTWDLNNDRHFDEVACEKSPGLREAVDNHSWYLRSIRMFVEYFTDERREWKVKIMREIFPTIYNQFNKTTIQFRPGIGRVRKEYYNKYYQKTKYRKRAYQKERYPKKNTTKLTRTAQQRYYKKNRERLLQERKERYKASKNVHFQSDHSTLT